MPRLLTLLFFIITGDVILNACICSGERLACEAISHSDVVFVGKALSNELIDGRTIFAVDRVYKGGILLPLIAIGTAAGTSCSETFLPGESYLVYAFWSKGRVFKSVWTTACAGSRRIGDAKEHLAYLDAWQKQKTPTQAVGSIYTYPELDGGRSLSDARLELMGRGGVRVVASPNPKGEFAVTMPRPGNYTASVFLKDWFVEAQSIEVPLRGCAEIEFRLRPDNEISGQVVDANGAPVAQIPVRLTHAAKYGADIMITTDAGGEFRFRGLQPGGYRVGVNTDGMDDPSSAVPFGPTYYPGVHAEKQATVIELARMQKIRLRALPLGPRLHQRTIHVFVTLDTGEPLREASVSCSLAGRSPWSTELTDDDGRISFDATDGLPYIVDAAIGSDHPLARHGYEVAKWVRVPPGSQPAEIRIVFRKRQPSGSR